MGATGTELIRFCRKNKISYIPFDDNKKVINKSERISSSENDFKNLIKKCSEIIVSPGIGLRNKNIELAKKLGKKIVSEIEFASRYINKPVIAITGTNGKTTTTLLTLKLLESAGYKVFLGGNIGSTLINVVSSQNQYDVILIEASSFQLQFVQSFFKPFIAVFLNISENHLDHHLNMREYCESKMNIFRNQDQVCFALCSKDIYEKISYRNKAFFLNPFRNNGVNLSQDGITVNNEYQIRFNNLKLIGFHNLENISFALSIFSIFKKILPKQIKLIEQFTPPNHRLEIIRKYKEKIVINDSKSTSPQATETALKSLRKNVILLMGGKDKKLNYNLLKKEINKKVTILILFGENKFELAKFFNKSKQIIAIDLFDAVEKGLKNCSHGHTLLFSPGTSSFDQFNSYSERGDKFKEYVQKLS